MVDGNKLSRVLFRELYRQCSKFDRNPKLKATFRNPYYHHRLFDHIPQSHPLGKLRKMKARDENEEEQKVFEKVFGKEGLLYKPVVSFRKVLKAEFIENRNATGQQLHRLQDNAFTFLRLMNQNEKRARELGILETVAEGAVSRNGKPSESSAIVEPPLRVLQDYTDADIVPGMYLVAHPLSMDNNFSRTVVLICDVTPDNIMGLVINRPMWDKGLEAMLSKFGDIEQIMRYVHEANVESDDTSEDEYEFTSDEDEFTSDEDEFTSDEDDDDEFTSDEDDDGDDDDAYVLGSSEPPSFAHVLQFEPFRKVKLSDLFDVKSLEERLKDHLIPSMHSSESQGLKNCETRYGGPVQSKHVLHTADGVKGSQKVADNIYFDGDLGDISQKLQDGDVKNSQFKFFNGASTWTRKQLLGELDRGLWFAVKDENGLLNELVFPATEEESNPETKDAETKNRTQPVTSLQKWSHVMQLMGSEYAELKDIPPDAMK